MPGGESALISLQFEWLTNMWMRLEVKACEDKLHFIKQECRLPVKLWAFVSSLEQSENRNTRDVGCDVILDMFAASMSAAICLFHLFLRFWNQILTWVSVSRREEARVDLSVLERYRFASNVDSSWKTWLLENTVRVFFFLVVPDKRSSSLRLDSFSGGSSSVVPLFESSSELWILFLVFDGLFTGAEFYNIYSFNWCSIIKWLSFTI